MDHNRDALAAPVKISDAAEQDAQAYPESPDVPERLSQTHCHFSKTIV